MPARCDVGRRSDDPCPNAAEFLVRGWGSTPRLRDLEWELCDAHAREAVADTMHCTAETIDGGETVGLDDEGEWRGARRDEDACPGCGCVPGDGVTASCDHPLGCGHWKTPPT